MHDKDPNMATLAMQYDELRARASKEIDECRPTNALDTLCEAEDVAKRMDSLHLKHMEETWGKIDDITNLA